jgi:microcystin-dependent protein
MDEPYIGEIRPIAINYAPTGWAFCNGQLLPINQNQALFALLGTQFGGNGQTTFALPDLRSRIPVGSGQSQSSGTLYVQSDRGGQEQVVLTQAQIPAHSHQVTGTLQTSDFAEGTSPVNNVVAADVRGQFTDGAANVQMGSAANGTTGTNGGSAGHENRMPYQAINYVIALRGLFPSRM